MSRPAAIKRRQSSDLGSQARLAKLPSALQSRFGFTRSEAIVAALLADGLAYSEVANSLGVSRNTIHTHVNAIHKKAAVHTTARLTALIHATVSRRI